MITGVVSSLREAVIRLRLFGSNGGQLEVDVIIDTGFTGTLTLPSSVIKGLALVASSVGTSVLADGSRTSYGIYNAQIEWDGSIQSVLVSEMGNEPLLGMRLLRGHQLRMQVRPHGLVELSKLP